MRNEKLHKNWHNEYKDTCGYCGKIVEVSKSDFEIDHFVPKSLAKSKINNYEQLENDRNFKRYSR